MSAPVPVIEALKAIENGRPTWTVWRSETDSAGRRLGHVKLATFSAPGATYRFLLDARAIGQTVRGIEETRDAYEAEQGSLAAWV